MGITQEERIRSRIAYDTRPESEKILDIPKIEVLEEPTEQSYYGLFYKSKLKHGESQVWYVVNNQFYQNEYKARAKAEEMRDMDDIARVMLIKLTVVI